MSYHVIKAIPGSNTMIVIITTFLKTRPRFTPLVYTTSSPLQKYPFENKSLLPVETPNSQQVKTLTKGSDEKDPSKAESDSQVKTPPARVGRKASGLPGSGLLEGVEVVVVVVAAAAAVVGIDIVSNCVIIVIVIHLPPT